MSWLQIDDNMMDHPKILSLSDAAFRLHVTALCYCARHLTDGVLSREAYQRCTAGVSRASRSRSTKRLIEVGLWVERGTGYEIHDYLDWNPSREKVLSKRKARSEAGKRGAANRWDQGADDPQPPKGAMANAMANANGGMANAMADRNAPLPSPPSDDLTNQEDSTGTPNDVLMLLDAIGEHEYSQAHLELMSYRARGASEFDFRAVARAVTKKRPGNPRSYAVVALENRLNERTSA